MGWLRFFIRLGLVPDGLRYAGSGERDDDVVLCRIAEMIADGGKICEG